MKKMPSKLLRNFEGIFLRISYPPLYFILFTFYLPLGILTL